MATNAQRSQSICDALINGVSSQAQQIELAEALHDSVILGSFDQLTNAQKAEIIPRVFRQFALSAIRALRARKAAALAVDPAGDFPEG